MKIKKTYFFVLLLFFLTIIEYYVPVHAAHESEESKNILILNSYHSGYTWTDNQTQGIISTLQDSSINTVISAEYLDWKRYPSQENLSNIYQNLKFKYQNKEIDLLICTDDKAFSFATQYREELFSNAPIIFSGINSEGLTELGASVRNYTGVLEEIDPYGTIKVAKEINPSLDTIYLIYDNSESGLSTGELCIQAAKELDENLNVISLNTLSSKEIINKVKDASENTMVFMITYSFDIDNRYITNEHFCQKLSNVSPVPIYNIYNYGLENGCFGGHLTSGQLQGESAGQLAIRVLLGEAASSIPVIETNTNQYQFDYSLLNKYDISTRDLPANSTFINEPFSFIKTYPLLVITVTCIFVLLTIFTLVLLFYINKINMMKKILQGNNEELTQLYEELTATEEEIRTQYINLANAHRQLEENNDTLYYLAHHDALTGLRNRLYLYEEIETQLFDSTMISALLFMDIDNFKFVNDSLGHSIGDELLIQISKRLTTISSNNCYLVRLGGDEFVFFIREMEHTDTAYEFALKIIELFSSPFKIQENALMLTVSIGISISPENGTNIDALLRNADMAMYKVKDNGKNGISFFNQHIKEELLERINIEKYFDKALKEDEFIIHYQPQIITNTHEIDGFEALIRWNSPELGMLSPLKFISIAEETGFIIPLGEWILRSSCKYIKKLNFSLNRNFKISVNISVIQLMQEDFISMVRDIITELEFPPHLLELEITESVIMESADLLSGKFGELRSMGIRIALDDFGTGYSSLAYLKQIPITTLKVDKLFIDDIVSLDSGINLADIIINLGHKMNLSIVAEGVETSAQAQYLRSNGCDKIQGYFYSKPLTQHGLEKWILDRAALST